MECGNHAWFLSCGEASKQYGPGSACARQRTGRPQGTPESWLPLPVARNLIPLTNDEEESALRVASSPFIILLIIFSVFSHDFRFFSWAHRGAGKPPCAPSSCASPAPWMLVVRRACVVKAGNLICTARTIPLPSPRASARPSMLNKTTSASSAISFSTSGTAVVRMPLWTPTSRRSLRPSSSTFVC